MPYQISTTRPSMPASFAVGTLGIGVARFSEKRATPMPNVPTAKEAGVDGLVVDIWYGVLAPAATPPTLVNRLSAEINKALAAPDMKERLLGAGIQPVGTTPEQFGSFIRSETVRFAKVIKDAGIKPE